MLTLNDPVIAAESPEGKDLSAAYVLDRAFVEAAKEINIDWPVFLPAERVKVGTAKAALGLFLLAWSLRTRARNLFRPHSYLGLLAKPFRCFVRVVLSLGHGWDS